jgi:hypothetical protein
MQLDAILEVVIGLVFSWLVLSISTSEIQEVIKRIFNLRAKHLQKSILEMFKYEQALVDQFYSHPAIMELSKIEKNGEVKKPDYIPNDVFSEVAMEILMNARKGASESESSEEAVSFGVTGGSVGNTLNPEIINLTDRLFPDAPTVHAEGAVAFSMDFNEMRVQLEEKVEKYKKNVSHWFDNVMTQSSDWYRKNAQVWCFWIGLVLALFFNVDSINIANELWREPTKRQALVAQVEAYNPDDPNATPVGIDSFNTLVLPVGWTSVPAEDSSVCNQNVTTDGRFTLRVGNECHVRTNVPSYYDVGGWLTKLIGILLSAFAARQGAPFWFDILKKLISAKGQVSSKTEMPAG